MKDEFSTNNYLLVILLASVMITRELRSVTNAGSVDIRLRKTSSCLSSISSVKAEKSKQLLVMDELNVNSVLDSL